MSRSFIGRLVAAVLLIAIGVLAFFISPALAATRGEGTLGILAQTPTTTPTTTTPYVPTDLFVAFLIILLVFGFLLILGLLFYIYRIQLKYYTTARMLSQMGARVTAVQVVAFPPDHMQAMIVNAKPDQPPQQLTIDGPGTMSIGIPGEFKATDPSGKPADNAQWSVTPASAANLNVNTGSKISVNPLATGPFKLHASQDPNAIGEALVAVVTPQASAEDLPFVGQGYGALVIAVLVVVAVIVLALTGALQGEAVATLLGGLLGYIFGTATSSGTASKAQSRNPPNAGG
jgi:hypothetical protein